MATARKDFRGRVLRKGEVQRASDKRYMYCYTDPFGRRKYIYANDLVTLREKEMRLTKNQLDGLDTYVAGYATVNFVFDEAIIFICMTAMFVKLLENERLRILSIPMCFSFIIIWLS